VNNSSYSTPSRLDVLEPHINIPFSIDNTTSERSRIRSSIPLQFFVRMLRPLFLYYNTQQRLLTSAFGGGTTEHIRMDLVSVYSRIKSGWKLFGHQWSESCSSLCRSLRHGCSKHHASAPSSQRRVGHLQQAEAAKDDRIETVIYLVHSMHYYAIQLLRLKQ